MKRIHRGLASVVLAAGLFGFLPTDVVCRAGAQEQNRNVALSPQELFKRLSPSIFVVEALDENGSLVALGSGVAVTPTLVVTNKHVVEDGVSFRITQGNKTWPGALTYLDPDHDLCGLTAVGLKAPPVPVRKASTLSVGERVYAIGAPEGLELTISDGLISGLREFEQTPVIQTSAAISHGSSGGGLFDSEGRLVGITTFFMKEGQNLNFALPGEWVLALASHQFSPEEKSKVASPTFQALSWFELGHQMLQAGENERAVDAFRELVRLTPADAAAWTYLGFAYDQLSQYERAVSALQEAIRVKPDGTAAWYVLGSIYGEQGNRSEAMRVYEKLKTLDQNLADKFFHEVVQP